MNFQHIPDELALKQLLHQFVDAGLHGRFTEAFDLLDVSYAGIGMGEQGVVHSKEEALLVLRDGFRPVEGTVITCDVRDVNISWLGEDAAIIFCRVIVTSTPVDGQPTHSELMQTIGARRSNECWCIAFTHASPVLLSVESVEAYPVRFLDGTLSELRTALLSQQQPHCDALTGVLNREGLQLRAAELQREPHTGHSTALFMLDLDDFKQINDRLGHQTGDSVLQKVAQTLCSTFRDGDAVGRIGGDEFMVLISGDLSVKFLEKKADELLEAMRLQVTDDEQIAVSVSIGIAYGRSCTTFEKLYLIADTALYTAKRAGKARYYLINSDTNAQHSSGGRGANLLSLQTLLKRADGKESPGGTPYEALVENIPGGIIMFELSYSGSIHFTLCNEWFIRLVGYSSSEFFAMQAENPFALVHPDESDMVTRAVQSMIDGADSGNLIYRVRHKDGSYSYIKQVISVTERSHGSMTVFGALTDVDEIMQATNCRVQAHNQDSEKDEELHSAERDELTGLLSKRAFYQEMQELIRCNPDQNFVLIRWNLVRFKVVNDLFGAGVGDRVLKILAQTLRKYTDGLAALGRLESDHFVSCYFAEHFSMDTVQAILSERLSPTEINYPITLKCGIYEVDDRTLPIDQMCDRANLALQTIKGKYMARHVFYDNALRQALLAEQEIEGDMNRALEEGQFVVYFQPIYSVSTKRPISAEALVRWQHPTKGMISPGVFIPLFEKNGFISKLDRYVREQTLRFVAQSLMLKRPIIPISVNISRIEFYSADFCDNLIRLVEQYQIHPSMLRLEITESAYTDNADALLSAMRQLQKYGFQILMDDFGSGYSSLNMLKDIPVNILKIDMQFVQDITSSDRAASVLSSVVRMAKWLEMQVVAEGVETIEQLTFLRSIGCDSVQGYYYSKPLPEADFVSLLERDMLDTGHHNEEDALDESDFDVFWNAQQGMALLNAMIGPVGIYELRENQLELICVNDAYYEMTGMTPSTLFSETLQATAWIYQEDRDKVIHACRQAQESRLIQRIKVRRHHNLGRMLWVDMRIRYIGRRNARNVFCFEMEDITEQENRQRMNEIEPYIVDICHTYDVIYQLNYTEMTSMAMYYTNGSALNTDREELWTGLGIFFEQVHPDDRPMLLETFALEALQSAFADGRKTLDKTARLFHDGHCRLFSMVIVRAAHTDEQAVYLACVKVLQKQEDVSGGTFGAQLPQSLPEQIDFQALRQRLKVLVVDDNQLNRMMLRKMLADRYDVLEAENGQQALHLLASNGRDIVTIMLDIIMPIMDGYAFLQARAANDSFAAIPVIVLSHSDDRDAELRALSLGANDFLKKPYEPVVIKQRLENFIRLREAAERNKHSEETIRRLTQACASLEETNEALRRELKHASRL